MINNKKELRKKFLALRKHDIKKDQLVQKNLIKLIDGFNSVSLYYAINEEISLNDLFLHLSKKADVYLPYTNKEIEFRKFTSFADLLPDKAGIMSPNSREVKVNDIEVMVMACIACSVSGYRLGYGAGHYDRALENYQGLKIGIVYDECLLVEDFHHDHDVKLDYIITESKIIRMGK